LPGEVEKVEEGDQMISSHQAATRHLCDWGCGWVTAGYYGDQTNPYQLLMGPSQISQARLQLPSLHWADTGLREGDVLDVELSFTEKYNLVYLHPAASYTRSDYLTQLWRQFEMLSLRERQEDCQQQPPVVQPNVGLAVAALHRDHLEFHRAVVTQVTEEGATVQFNDFGHIQFVRDFGEMKELPKSWSEFPGIAIRTELCVAGVGEEEEDTLFALMEEALMTCAELAVRILELRPDGTICGHLLNRRTENFAYKGLVREKVIVTI